MEQIRINFEENLDISFKVAQFKNRELKAKSLFSILEIDKKTAYNFVRKYHYLKDARFFSKFAYGLYIEDVLVGCCAFSNPQGINSLKTWFNFTNDNQSVLELSRLCMLPILNGTNATSFLLGNSIKILKKKSIRAVITLADDSKHIGSIYQVCNFNYYGLTDSKTDFYSADGKVNPRGKTKDLLGVWLPRTKKHRYAFIIDKKLNVKLKQEEPPKKKIKNNYDCCNNTNIVFDKRFKIYYTCPKCTNTINDITEDVEILSSN